LIHALGVADALGDILTGYVWIHSVRDLDVDLRLSHDTAWIVGTTGRCGRVLARAHRGDIRRH
jgi:hypothetical protein